MLQKEPRPRRLGFKARKNGTIPLGPLLSEHQHVRPAPAQLVGLRVRHGVHDLLGEPAKQLPHVDGAVVETGHGEHVRRRV